MIFAQILALAIAQITTPQPTVPLVPSPTPTPIAPAASPSCAPAPTPCPSGSPTMSPTAAGPTPLATATAPAVLTSATPIALTYRFVPHQPLHLLPGQPQIFAVYLNGSKLHSRAPIRIKVETSPDVVKVVSRSNGREGTLAFVSAGDFEATSVLPKIPFIAAGMSVNLEFIATGPDGRKVVVRVPVTLGS